MNFSDLERRHMQRALQLAERGQGHVEPNPMVGCVIVCQDHIVSEGWHRRYGGPHAEVDALLAASSSVNNGTMFVTLEPCCHDAKTPPCTTAIKKAGIRKVVIAEQDPYSEVCGRGIAELQSAGLEVEIGLLAAEAHLVNAPYHKLLAKQQPWVIAKWAMTMDGNIATHTGSSRWISGEESRTRVHKLRGRVDAVLVGRKTAAQDDPLLTARPPGPRQPLRIVMDSQASLSDQSQLVRTAKQHPVMVVTVPEAEQQRVEHLESMGCEIFCCSSESPVQRMNELLDELGKRRITNVLAEGGGELLGSLFDLVAIDEVHVFIAPKLVGGQNARGAILGDGTSEMIDARGIEALDIQFCDQDIYISGRIRR